MALVHRSHIAVDFMYIIYVIKPLVMSNIISIQLNIVYIRRLHDF